MDNQHAAKRSSDTTDVSPTTCNVKRAKSDGTPRHIVQLSVENPVNKCFDLLYIPYESFPEFMRQRIASHYTDPRACDEKSDGVIFRYEINRELWRDIEFGNLRAFMDTMHLKSQTRDFKCIELSFLILLFEMYEK